MIHPMVITDIKREGRGFSLKEIKEAGIDVHKARKLGFLVDKRRKTSYEENVQKIRDLLTPAKEKPAKKKVKKKVTKKKKPKEKKKKVTKKPKKKEKAAKERKIALTEVKDIGKKRAETLKDAGITSANDLVSLSVEEIVEKAELTEKMAKKLKGNAEEAV
ncbi:MAG: ribosomal protein L13e [Euryarchaeota archaeon]|nr:ribosomal protein L13e [Euryarchaeota archaeon]